MKKGIILLIIISSFSLVFAKEQSIEVADIVPGIPYEGEPALILGKDGTLIAQMMGDNPFKRLDMFGKVKQIGEFSVLSNDGTIYLWTGNPIFDKSSETNTSQLNVVQLSDQNYELMAESRFGINSLVMANKNGEVFYIHIKSPIVSTTSIPKIKVDNGIHKIIPSGRAITALTVFDIGDASRANFGKDFYKNIFVVVAREDKSIQLGIKKVYPKPEDSEFSVCRLPDTPNVVKKVFVGENGVSVLLKNGKIAAYSDFECSNDASQWHYYAIGTTKRFIDVDSNGFEYSALGNDHKMYICSTGYDEKGFVKGLIPSKSQLAENKIDGYCSMRKSPINNAIRIRSNGDEIDLIDSKGNFYFWNAIGDDFDFKKPPMHINFSKYLKEQ